jgi:hypothetical protein
MSNNNSVPGMMLPTQKGMPAGNPRDSAIHSMNSNNQSSVLASKLLSGGRHKKRRFRGGQANSNIAVPQFQMQYEPQGGPGSNPNNQIQGNSQTSTQMAANSALDSGATKMGGSRRRKGGNPDWVWGCMSGGKKRRTYKRYTKRNKKNTNRNKQTRKYKK